VSAEEEFHSMHFSLLVLEAADDWNDDSASVGFFQKNQRYPGILFCVHQFKGTVRPDWICLTVVPLDSPLKGHQPLYVYNF
jgi:hypothetical protein